MFKNLIKKLDGSTIERNLSQYQVVLKNIRKYEVSLENLPNEKLQSLVNRLTNQTTDQILEEFFAIVSVIIQRTLKLRPFDVQIIGALAMHQGKLIEMQTGEGKTLTAVFTAALNGMSKKGVHILTFNDYLAKRDANWMRPVYEFLGLSVGFVQEGMSKSDRKKAYASDITYLTAKEAGFDFLRDGLCYNKSDKVQREYNLAIIDEADSILIDEARIPLVIAGASEDKITDITYLAKIIKNLDFNTDIIIEKEERNFHLSDTGIQKVETFLNISNIFDSENLDMLTKINCAIHAEYLLKKDVDYIIKQGKIELVDEFTGRIADKRRWPDGLQAALEVKENLVNHNRGNILNSITLQHFIQLYSRCCGMTATAQDSDEEFRHFYDLDITVIPPNRNCIRKDLPDVIYKTKAEKKSAIINHIIDIRRTGRPILVGTASVRESEELSKQLSNHGLTHDVLNAKEDELEADIIAQAGRLNAITISTNMAGRGTDIRLGAGDKVEKDHVIKLGGLFVLGTSKFESPRIDKQLRGRAGRQGDPGTSQYFISLEDDLAIKFGLKDLLNSKVLRNHQTGPIESKILNREITRLQRIITGQNLEIKKTLNKYSSVLEQQRQIIFHRREKYFNRESATEFFISCCNDQFNKIQQYTSNISLLCQKILFKVIDHYWSLYLADVAELREGIHLHRLGGDEPFLIFQKEVLDIFEKRLSDIEKEAIAIFNSINITKGTLILDENNLKAPASTWTYLINDNPFEQLIGINVIGNIGLSLGAVIMTPFWIIRNLIKKKAL